MILKHLCPTQEPLSLSPFHLPIQQCFIKFANIFNMSMNIGTLEWEQARFYISLWPFEYASMMQIYGRNAAAGVMSIKMIH